MCGLVKYRLKREVDKQMPQMWVVLTKKQIKLSLSTIPLDTLLKIASKCNLVRLFAKLEHMLLTQP
jgi:hypothetical protein